MADEILATHDTAGAEALLVVDRRFLRRLKHVDSLSPDQQCILLATPVPRSITFLSFSPK